MQQLHPISGTAPIRGRSSVDGEAVEVDEQTPLLLGTTTSAEDGSRHADSDSGSESTVSALSASRDGGAETSSSASSPLLPSRTDSDMTTLLADDEAGPGKHADGPPSSPFLGGVTTRQFRAVFACIMFTYFVVLFDSTILASSHPVITSHFGASHSASWLSTAYLLTSTAVQPVVGRASDSLGRKPPFVASLVLFIASTLGCALAPSIGFFIAARALGGVGGGGMMTMAAVCVGDMVPIERRGPYQSCLNVAYGLASMAGASLGGLMADTLGWRWEFGCQVPALLLCLAVVVAVVPADLGLHRNGGRREPLAEAMRNFDAKGSALLVACVAGLILGLDLGGTVLPWSHPFIVTCLAGTALVLIPLLLRVEARAERPVMPLELVRRAPVANLVFANHIAAFLTNAVLFNAPLFFQAVLLASPTASGARLAVPSLVSSAAGMATGVLVSRTRGLKWAPVLGACMFLAGTASLSAMRRGLPDALYVLCLVPAALGQGLQFPGTFLAVLGATEQREQAVVTTTLQLWRSLGAVAGIAGSSLALQAGLSHFLDVNVEEGPDKARIVEAVRRSVAAVARLPEPYRSQVVASYEAALSLTFACCAVLAAVSLLLLLPIKLPKLKPAAPKKPEPQPEEV
ncbi:hypothetical protein RB594_000305 [Gaeumannomyces avenae]